MLPAQNKRYHASKLSGISVCSLQRLSTDDDDDDDFTPGGATPIGD